MENKLDLLNIEIYYLTLDLHSISVELEKLDKLLDSKNLVIDNEKEAEIWDLVEDHQIISDTLLVKLKEYFTIEKELNVPISLSYRSLYKQLKNPIRA